jgi:hypothetical protein
LKNIISKAVSGVDVQGDLVLLRKPKVGVVRMIHSYQIRDRTRVLFVQGEPTKWRGVTRSDPCNPTFSKTTPKAWSSRQEVIPARARIPIHVVEVSGMNVAGFNALPIGTNFSNFPYVQENTYELAPVAATLILDDPPVASQPKINLDYLSTSFEGLFPAIMLNLGIAIVKAIPKVGDAAGAVTDFIAGLTGLATIGYKDEVLGSPLPTGDFEKYVWTSDNDSFNLSLTTNISYITGGSQNLFAGSVGNILETHTGFTKPGPWVDLIDVGFAGDRECQMRSEYSTVFSEVAFENSAMTASLQEVSPGGSGKVNGSLQYRLLFGVNRPEEIDVNGNKVTGWNTVFVDGRPYAFFDGVAWTERPELVESE